MRQLQIVLYVNWRKHMEFYLSIDSKGIRVIIEKISYTSIL